jgi:hypothetical protein
MFSKESRKANRQILVDFIFNQLNSVNIPNKVKAFLLRSIHFHTPGAFFVLFLLLKFEIAIFCLIPLLTAFTLFFYFEGCFITIVEYKLDQENHINIIDPYLYLYDIEINDDNRYKYTLFISLIYFTVVGCVLTFKYNYNL